MKNLSNWRSVRLWESSIEQQLRRRYVLWLHGLWIGVIVLLAMWAASHVQMLLGNQSLALRYLITLGVGYLSYLLVLRLWAAALLRRDSNMLDGSGDIGVPDFGSGSGSPNTSLPQIKSGGSGDFGGGGATGDFSGAASPSDGMGELASGAIEAVAGADEAAIVVVPVVAIFLVGLAVVLGAGSLALLYFGWDVLLVVAVELAFSFASARTAVRVAREGWLQAAVRLTWKPLLGALVCAVLLGALLDYFLPEANSLLQAIRLLR